MYRLDFNRLTTLRSPYGTLLLATAAMVLSVILGWLATEFRSSVLIFGAIALGSLIALIRPEYAFYFFVGTLPVQNTFVIEGDATVTGTRLLGIIVFGAWMIRKLAFRESFERILKTRLLIPALVFIGVAVATLLLVDSLSRSGTRIITLVQLLLLMLMAVDIIDSWEKLERMFRVVVLGGLAASIFMLFQYYQSDDVIVRAGRNVAGGVNASAFTLVIIWQLAWNLARNSTSNFWRVVSIVMLAISPLAVIASLSRFSIIILGIIIAVSIQQAYRKKMQRSAVVATLAMLIVFVVGSQFIDWDALANRIGQLTAFFDTAPTLEDDSTDVRVHHWRGALAIFTDHPITGVGYGNFGYEFLDYQFDPRSGSGGVVFSTLRSPHSSVFGLMAEMGIVGGLLWVTLFFVAFSNVSSAIGNDALPDNARFVAMTAAILILTFGVASIASVIHSQKLFWLILGTTEIVRTLVASEQERDDPLAVEAQAPTGAFI